MCSISTVMTCITMGGRRAGMEVQYPEVRRSGLDEMIGDVKSCPGKHVQAFGARSAQP